MRPVALGTLDADDLAGLLEASRPGFLETLGRQAAAGLGDTTTAVLGRELLMGPRADFSAEGELRPGLDPRYADERRAADEAAGLRAMTEAEWRASPSFRPDLEFDPWATPERAAERAAIHDARRLREARIAQRRAGVFEGALGFGARMTGNLPDPVNLVPFIGPAWKAAVTAKAATRATYIARAAGLATAENAIGTAAVLPLLVPSLAYVGDDTSFTEAVLDIAIGSAIGAGLGTGGAWWATRGGRGWKLTGARSPDAPPVFEPVSLDDMIRARGLDQPIPERLPADPIALAREVQTINAAALDLAMHQPVDLGGPVLASGRAGRETVALRPGPLLREPAPLREPLSVTARRAVANPQWRGEPTTLGVIGDDAALLVNGLLANARRATGAPPIDVRGLTFTADPRELRKNANKHLGENEKDSRNLPLRWEDFDLLPEILAAPDRVGVSRSGSPRQAPTIEISKRIDDELLAVVQVQSQAGRLALKSFQRKADPRGGGDGGGSAGGPSPGGADPVRPTEPVDRTRSTDPERRRNPATSNVGGADRPVDPEDPRFAPWDASPGRPPADPDAAVQDTLAEPDRDPLAGAVERVRKLAGTRERRDGSDPSGVPASRFAGVPPDTAAPPLRSAGADATPPAGPVSIPGAGGRIPDSQSPDGPGAGNVGEGAGRGKRPAGPIGADASPGAARPDPDAAVQDTLAEPDRDPLAGAVERVRKLAGTRERPPEGRAAEPLPEGFERADPWDPRSISNWVRRALASIREGMAGGRMTLVGHRVNPGEAAIVRARTGEDIEGYTHIFERSAVRHVESKHGPDSPEARNGGVPVVPEDYDRIPDVLAAPDDVTKGKTDRGADALIFEKRMPDGTWFYVEQVRVGRRTLALSTFYKIRRKGEKGGVSEGLDPDRDAVTRGTRPKPRSAHPTDHIGDPPPADQASGAGSGAEAPDGAPMGAREDIDGLAGAALAARRGARRGAEAFEPLDLGSDIDVDQFAAARTAGRVDPALARAFDHAEAEIERLAALEDTYEAAAFCFTRNV